MNFQFTCVRKHLIFDKQYLLTYDGSTIFIGETKSKPKYQLEVSLRSRLSFNIDNDLYGFSIEHKGTQKLFIANTNKLKEFKRLLDARIVYLQMNQFYVQQEILGSGAFSQVSMVKNLQTKQLVAAKYLDKIREGKSKNERMNDIINEIQILYRLNHPNIVKIKEIYERNNQIVIIHEYVNGQTLEQFIIDREIILHQTEIQSIMRQILLAIIYIHEQGLLHRDIKPDNIMIDKEMNIKLIDFGLATKQGSPLCIQKCGTPGYMAPELLLQNKTYYNNKCDMFSIGVVFYKLLSTKDLFKIDSQDQIEFQDAQYQLEKLNEQQLPESCQDLLNQMLCFDRQKRINAKDALKHPYFRESFRPSAKSAQLLQRSSSLQQSLFQSQLSDKQTSTSLQKSNKSNPILSSKKSDSSL